MIYQDGERLVIDGKRSGGLTMLSREHTTRILRTSVGSVQVTQTDGGSVAFDCQGGEWGIVERWFIGDRGEHQDAA